MLSVNFSKLGDFQVDFRALVNVRLDLRDLEFILREFSVFE